MDVENLEDFYQSHSDDVDYNFALAPKSSGPQNYYAAAAVMSAADSSFITNENTMSTETNGPENSNSSSSNSSSNSNSNNSSSSSSVDSSIDFLALRASSFASIKLELGRRAVTTTTTTTSTTTAITAMATNISSANEDYGDAKMDDSRL